MHPKGIMPNLNLDTDEYLGIYIFFPTDLVLTNKKDTVIRVYPSPMVMMDIEEDFPLPARTPQSAYK